MKNIDTKIMQYVRKISKEGEYVIVDFDEICSAIKAEGVDCSEFKEVIDRLEYQGYVRVKYVDMTECCLTATAKSRAFCRDGSRWLRKREFSYAKCFVISMMGGFIGCIIFTFVYEVLRA